MDISQCMTKADEVISCYATDTIERALELILASPTTMGAVVVLHPTGNKHIPVGIVTKTDLLQAYQKRLNNQEHKVREIMSTMIETLQETQTVAEAAEYFYQSQHHHVFVVNQDKQWIGLITTWDVAIQLAKDHRDWPWNNREGTSKVQTHDSATTQMKDVPSVQPSSDVLYKPTPSFLGIAGAYE